MTVARSARVNSRRLHRGRQLRLPAQRGDPSLLAEIGLVLRPGFITDRRLHVALLAAPLTLLVIELMLPTWRTGITLNATVLLGMVLLYPVVEELLFRGVIQGVIQGMIQGMIHRAIQGKPQGTPRGAIPDSAQSRTACRSESGTHDGPQGINRQANAAVRQSPSFARHFPRNWRMAIVSPANLLTTALFALFHLLQHPPLWAAAVIVPSLLFGYFRERHGHIYGALTLHAAYNACYLLLGTHFNMTNPL